MAKSIKASGKALKNRQRRLMKLAKANSYIEKKGISQKQKDRQDWKGIERNLGEIPVRGVSQKEVQNTELRIQKFGKSIKD